MQQLPDGTRLNQEVRGMISGLIETIADERFGFDALKALVAFLDEADDPYEDSKTMSFPFSFYSADPPVSLVGPYISRLLMNFAGRNGAFWLESFWRFTQHSAIVWPKYPALGKKIPILWPFNSAVIMADPTFEGWDFDKIDQYVSYDNHFEANFRLCEVDASDDHNGLYAYDLIAKSKVSGIINAVGRDNLFVTPDRMLAFMQLHFKQKAEYSDVHSFMFFVKSRCGDEFIILWSMNNKACNTVARRVSAIYNEEFSGNIRVICTREF